MPNKTADVSGVSFTIGAESANVINVALQLEGPHQGIAAGVPCGVTVYLSDDAAGQTVATAPDTVAIGTDGTLITTATDFYFLITEADGDADIDITEAGGADTFYLNVVLPNGQIVTSDAITFA